MKALAYYNYGRWVADCPVPGCNDALALYPEDRYGHPSPTPIFNQRCAKGHPMEIEAPDERTRVRIEQTLAERPHLPDQGWYPKGHPATETYGYPAGQSIEELRAETQHVARLRAAALSDGQRAVLLDALASAGIEVGEDGSFHGNLNAIHTAD